jgi:hypothetical protein
MVESTTIIRKPAQRIKSDSQRALSGRVIAMMCMPALVRLAVALIVVSFGWGVVGVGCLFFAM